MPADPLKVGLRMLLTHEPDEILRLLSETVDRIVESKASTIFLYDADANAFTGGRPDLLPEKEVIDFVFAEHKPPTIPHKDGRFITVFPLRAGTERVGLMVLDVTGVAEEAAQTDLDPVIALCEQAAVALLDAWTFSRAIGESTLLSNILDSISNAIVTTDNNRKITRLNRNAMAMLGTGPEAVGRHYRDVFPPEVTAAVDEILRETRNVGFAMERMATTKLPRGQELHIAVSTSILRNRDGDSLGTIAVFRDMTASHELERLRKLDSMKSDFVANVSHELKTPLTSIKAYTEALLDMATSGEALSFLKVIDQESDRLIFLINDLLNISHLQSGKMKMNFAPVAPRRIAEEILALSKVQSEKHPLRLEIADDLPELLLDKEKMKEVLINLVSNAIKYSPEGGDVRIGMRIEETNLRLEVQDRGPGIPKVEQANLFQTFYRTSSSRKANIHGTGLGLAIVKGIVESHGGRVWVESEPGRGATFCAVIPARRPQGPAGPAPEPALTP